MNLLEIWEHIDRTGDCWCWTGTRSKQGYGIVYFNGKSQPVPRIVYELVYGPIPKGKYVCHRCDNPPCCRPEHLFAGSPSENNFDSSLKGRRSVGGWHLNRGCSHCRFRPQFGCVRQAIREMCIHSPLHRVLKEELTALGYWRNKPRGDPAKGYRIAKKLQQAEVK